MAERPPYVTVAMITYNHERFIAEAVDSILAQTYRDFELVIVDDGSTDGTGEVIRAARDERIRYVRQENQGPSVARNTALRNARGTVIAQMSGDDVAEATRLEKQIARLHERPDSVVFSHCSFIGDRGETLQDSRAKTLNRPNWTRDATLRHLYFHGNCFLAPSAVTTRAAFERIGPYSPVMLQLQDYDMWVRFLLNGYEADIVEEPLLRYRVRSDGANVSTPSSASRARNHFESRRVLRNFLAIGSAERVAAIFPEAASLGYPLVDALAPFLLAMIALDSPHAGDALRDFAGDLLMDLMQSPESRSVLEHAGFTLPDFYRTLGKIEFESERLRRRVASLQAQLDDVLASRTWRAARLFRDFAGVRVWNKRR